MGNEVCSILQKKTWETVPRSQADSVIGSRFVLCTKYGTNGEPEKRKARVVAKRCFQEFAENYYQKFTPVALIDSIRLAYAVAARDQMHIYQYDVATAYLNGDLEEEVYMEMPKEISKVLTYILESIKFNKKIVNESKELLREMSQNNNVYWMKKALYGLKQTGRAWHTRLDGELRKLGATPTAGDPCVYLKGTGGDRVIILIYVDDILIMSRKVEKIERFGTLLRNIFELKALGKLKHCLGMEFKMDQQEYTINLEAYLQGYLHQGYYLEWLIVTRCRHPSQWVRDSPRKSPGLIQMEKNHLIENSLDVCYISPEEPGQILLMQ